ncbi:helix-turn-helix domain-containing protein [Citrobacter freundii]|nr:helix-turn-helix domain-containing protein [Citrobacter freundii]ELJ9990415.1 helix-turn-helix domain-containing protein [Citrobacter freundii]EMC0438026.1 helix-turn-helix domain-containing protein [Citrobacter freundii]EMD0452284.1 helix-turn-helix domain-containing protein [Citrobacter freundii]
MKLKQFTDSLTRGELSKLAIGLGISASFLSQMASGAAKVPVSRALAIEKATGGLVTRKDLLPDDWAKYWLPDELDYTESQRQGVEQ